MNVTDYSATMNVTDYSATMNVTDYSATMDKTDYRAYTVGTNIWQWMSCVLIICGTLGNGLTIIVLSRAKTRRSSTAMYLIALACADLIVLYTGLLRQWIKYTFDVDIRDLGVPVCKIHLFLLYLGTQMSSWILVAVTSERFIGVWYPYKVKMGCTTRSASVIIVVIIVCLAGLNSHFLFGYGERMYNDTLYPCAPVTDCYNHFIEKQWHWIAMCMMSLAPFVILVPANVAIIYKVVLSRRKTRIPFSGSLTYSSTSSGRRKFSSLFSARSKFSSLFSRSSRSSSSSSNSEVAASRRTTMISQLTFMLITINVVFCVCMFPMSIYLVTHKEQKSPKDKATNHLRWAIVNMLMFTNHTLNFAMYFLSGSRFRREVKVLFCGGRSRTIFPGAPASQGAVSQRRSSNNTSAIDDNSSVTTHLKTRRSDTTDAMNQRSDVIDPMNRHSDVTDPRNRRSDTTSIIYLDNNDPVASIPDNDVTAETVL